MLQLCVQGSVQCSVCPVLFCYRYVCGGPCSSLMSCVVVLQLYARVGPVFYMSYVLLLQLCTQGSVQHSVCPVFFCYSYVCKGPCSILHILCSSVTAMYARVCPAFCMSCAILLQLCMRRSDQHSICPVLSCYSYVCRGLPNILYVLCSSVTAMYAGVSPAFYVSFVILLQLCMRGCVQHSVCPCAILLQLCMQGSVQHSVCSVLFCYSYVCGGVSSILYVPVLSCYSYVCRGLPNILYVLCYSVTAMYAGVSPAFYVSFVIVLQLCMRGGVQHSVCPCAILLQLCMQGSVQHSVCSVLFCYSYVCGGVSSILYVPVLFCYSYVCRGLSSILYVLCYSVTAMYAGVCPAFCMSLCYPVTVMYAGVCPAFCMSCVILLQLCIRGSVKHSVHVLIVLFCSVTVMYPWIGPGFYRSCVLLLQLCMQGSVKRSVCPGVCAGLLDCGSCTIQGQGGVPHSGPTGLTQTAECAWCVKEAQCQKREGRLNLFICVSKTVCI